jgi:DNA-directed RNA polymerase specialized sigma24 family protein
VLLSDQLCCVPGCLGKIAQPGGNKKLGLCNRHSLQVKRTGRIQDGDKLIDLPGEQWADIESVGCVLYRISNMGRVMSLKNSCKRILTVRWRTDKQHLICEIRNRNGGKVITVAYAVARAFVSNIYGRRKISFLDGDPSNCCASNLQWVTVPEVQCSVLGCLGKVSEHGSKKRGLCHRHEEQLRRKGSIRDLDKLMDLPGEQWADIESTGHVIYRISNMGRVMSLRDNCKRILKVQWDAKRCRLLCTLQTLRRVILISSEVAKAFLLNPFGDKIVVFLDGDPNNCCFSNLQWYSVYWRSISLTNLRKEMEGGNENAADIVAFMEGNEESITRIINKYRPKMLGLLGYLLSFYNDIYDITDVDVESVLQEALLRAVLAMRRGLLRSASCSLSGWFNVIAKNTLLGICSSNKRIKEVDICRNFGGGDFEVNYSDMTIYQEWLREQNADTKYNPHDPLEAIETQRELPWNQYFDLEPEAVGVGEGSFE